MTTCQICKKEGCNKLVDFGKHPVCHKFTNGNEKEEKFSLILGPKSVKIEKIRPHILFKLLTFE